MSFKLNSSASLKGISFFVAWIFLFSSMQPVLLHAQTLSAKKTLVFEILKSLEGLDRQFGNLETFSSQNQTQISNDPFVIHIQDAHSQPSAQKNIAEILKYLAQKFPGISVAVEGAQGFLKPDYLDLFPNFSRANRSIVEDLVAKGELSGAEIFAWEEYQNNQKGKALRSEKNARVYGAEDPRVYREQYKIFLQFLKNRSRLDRALVRVQNHLMSEESKIFSPDLQTFLKEKSRRRDGLFQAGSRQIDPNLLAYLPYLVEQVQKNCAIDLKNPIEQIRFPHLIRMVHLLELDKANTGKDLLEASQKLMSRLRSESQSDTDRSLADALDLLIRRSHFTGKGISSSWNQEEALYARKLLDRLATFGNKHRWNWNDFTIFVNAFKTRIFSAEIQSGPLLKEMTILESALMDQWAKTREEKKLVEEHQAFLLAQKLMHLEISHQELLEVLKHQKTIELFSRLLARDEVFWSRHFSQALIFYDLALMRDKILLERAFQGSRQTVLVLISGGFHSEGITSSLEQRKIPFAVIQPKMAEAGNDERYYEAAMSGKNEDLTSYFQTSRPFRDPRAAILFREMFEKSVPVLFKEEHLSEKEALQLMVQAVSSHPLLSEAMVASILKKETKVSAEFYPRVPVLSNRSLASMTIIKALLTSRMGLVENEEISSNASGFHLELGAAGEFSIRTLAPEPVLVTAHSGMHFESGRIQGPVRSRVFVNPRIPDLVSPHHRANEEIQHLMASIQSPDRNEIRQTAVFPTTVTLQSSRRNVVSPASPILEGVLTDQILAPGLTEQSVRQILESTSHPQPSRESQKLVTNLQHILGSDLFNPKAAPVHLIVPVMSALDEQSRGILFLILLANPQNRISLVFPLTALALAEDQADLFNEAAQLGLSQNAIQIKALGSEQALLARSESFARVPGLETLTSGILILPGQGLEWGKITRVGNPVRMSGENLDLGVAFLSGAALLAHEPEAARGHDYYPLVRWLSKKGMDPEGIQAKLAQALQAIKAYQGSA